MEDMILPSRLVELRDKLKNNRNTDIPFLTNQNFKWKLTGYDLVSYTCIRERINKFKDKWIGYGLWRIPNTNICFLLYRKSNLGGYDSERDYVYSFNKDTEEEKDIIEYLNIYNKQAKVAWDNYYDMALNHDDPGAYYGATNRYSQYKTDYTDLPLEIGNYKIKVLNKETNNNPIIIIDDNNGVIDGGYIDIIFLLVSFFIIYLFCLVCL